MKKKILSFPMFLVGILAFANAALAGTAHVSWNANTEQDLDGYKIYYDTVSRASGACPSAYTQSYNVTDNATDHWFDNLTPGQTYYFRLTAYDTSANESACNATEVSKLITYRGDINDAPDHKVDVSDLAIFAGFFGQTIVHKADINRSGKVDVSDLSIFAGEYGSLF